MATLGSGQLTGRHDAAIPITVSALQGRQTLASEDAKSLSLPASVDPGSPSSLPSISTTATLSTGVTTIAIATDSASVTGGSTISSSEGTLIEAGSYGCTTSVNLDMFTDVLAQYLSNTETDLNATTRYLIMNLHAAAQTSDPTGPAHAPTADTMPHGSSLLSSIITGNNSAFLYTPSELQEQRANLNASGSWFGGSRALQPDAAYFGVDETDGHASTPDGWPSERFLEMVKAKRLLAGYGTIDPQMRAYNFSGDSDQIFSEGYLSASRVVTSNDDGVRSGCFYEEGTYSISEFNSSWAVSYQETAAPQSLLTDVANLTSCGISPVLNQTLENVTAAENFRPYQAYVYDTIWPWAPDEPRNSQQLRCAALNATTGRWQADDCTQSHYGACRVSNSPYRWQISDSQGIYMKVSAACNDGNSFAAPRTALENTYLAAEWRLYLASRSSSNTAARNAYAVSTDSGTDELLWLNFNDLNTATCWVTGQNSTCSYVQQPRSETRQVAVPTVAAVIVFVLAALTVFVKCASNRQNTKRRRRRKDNGWDYEGVPS